MEYLPIYLLAGAIVGFVRGLLGSGGAFYIVPALVFTFGAQQIPGEHIVPLALGTSAAAVALVSLFGASAHRRRGGLDMSIVRRMLPGLLLASCAGPFFVPYLPLLAQTLAFALMAGYAATQMLFNIAIDPKRELPGPVGMFGCSSVIGFSSSLVGGGGATLAIPFLLWCNVPMRTVIGTSSAISAPLAAVGAVGYALSGLHVDGLPEWSLGFVHLPAVAGVVAGGIFTVPLGTWLAYRVPVPVLKRLVAILLYTVVLRLVWRAL
jgi:uncharacterized membrane protein YfcA